MRKLIGAVMLSLDGVMQAPGGPEEDPSAKFELGGWVWPFWDEGGSAQFDKFLVEDEYDLLLGKRTYDIFAAYWPYNQDSPIGERFQRINKYVLTHSDEPLEWSNSVKISGETAGAVRQLKETDGPGLLIQGSSGLYPPLLSAGLIDRLVMITYPVLLGHGKSIFDQPVSPNKMKLIDHFVTERGVVFTTYEPDGDVQTGTFESKEPSEAELERRKNWTKEEA